MDKSDRDPLEYAIAHGKQCAISALIAHLNQAPEELNKIITYYLAKDAENPEEKSCLMLAMDHFCQQTSHQPDKIERMIKTLKMELNTLCLTTKTHALKIAFFSDLDKLKPTVRKSLRNMLFAVLLPNIAEQKFDRDYTLFRLNNV